MSKSRTGLRGAIAAVAAAAAIAAVPGSAFGYANGEVCNVNSDTPVWGTISPAVGNWMYTISNGNGFRIVSGASENAAWLYGHGINQNNGYVSQDRISRGTCHA
jgi:hypothetical protein